MMPLSGNVLFDIGLGPATLRDVYLLGLPHLPQAPKLLWRVITISSIFGAVLLVQYLFCIVVGILVRLIKSKSIVDMWMPILLLSACAFYSILIGIVGYFDRYFIFPLPLVMLLVMAPKSDYLHINMLSPPRETGEKGGSKGISRYALVEAAFSTPLPHPKLLGKSLSTHVAIIILFVYGYFSLAATHDYLSWNRSRWEALNYLTEKALVSYKDIDGGFEFNGWYNYTSTYREQSSKSWWWVKNDDYVVSFGPIRGFSEIKRYPYKRWLPLGEGNIFVLRKLAE
jgi:hypothetical protein